MAKIYEPVGSLLISVCYLVNCYTVVQKLYNMTVKIKCRSLAHHISYITIVLPFTK
jgi:hypothetical protein